MPLSIHGDVGKSTVLKMTAAGFTELGIEFETFDADKDNKTIHKAFSEKAKNGEPKAEQNSKTGCPIINIDRDPQAIVNTVAIERARGIVDTPARAVAAMFESFGIEGTQMYFDTFAFNNTLPLFQIPFTDNIKAPETLALVHQYLDPLDFSFYEPGFVAKIQIIINNGLMNAKSTAMVPLAMQALQESIALKALQNDPRFQVSIHTVRTQLTQPGINALAGKTIHQALSEKQDPAVKTLLNRLLMEGKAIASAI